MSARVRIYVKPARAPRWWPRDEKRRARWVGLLSNGVGWLLGGGDIMTRKQADQARKVFAADQIDDRGRARKFEIRMEKVS